jgi:hypothetical protein
MPPRRRIREGDQYTILEDIELEEREPDPNPPPEEVRGEPWGWTKPGDRPRGWPGPDHPRDEPGPFDGEWEPRR